ncbi:MAG: hypothetical protein NT109_07020 [Flavobacteriia bacterium]|nr:hypothetical protein [Flavobacteriia bacterium]
MYPNFRFLIVIFSLFISQTIFGLDYYWVGGTGNWSDVSRWSLTDGGTGGAGVPGVNDNCFFTNSSFSAVNQTVTINIANANCNNMTWSVTTNSPNFASTSGANNLNLYGNLAMVSTQGTWTTSMNVYFMGTGTKTINSGGKNFGPVFFAGTGTWSNTAAWNTGSITVSQAATLNFVNNVNTSTWNITAPATINFSALATINGDFNTSSTALVDFQPTSTGTISSGLNINGGATVNLQANRQIGYIYFDRGTLSTNGTTQTWGSFNSSPCCDNSMVRVLNLGSSTINCSNSWTIREGQLLTVNAGTSHG